MYQGQQPQYGYAPVASSGVNQSVDDGHSGLLDNNLLGKMTDKDIRMGFLRKVYTLMTIQLGITAVFVVIA
jgi:hypothetical protein